jgi:hypothetical protein
VAHSKRRQIWLAKVSRQNRDPNQIALVHDQFQPEILRGLDPDRQIIYYGRVWRLSQPQVNEDGTVFGKLGFARGARAEEVHYDESQHDWISEDAPSRQGNFSHFVIDLRTQVLAFEEKGDDLSRQSFLNALGLFLMPVGYEVILMSDSGSFDAWLEEVDRVTRFYVTLKRPNPGWSPRARQARAIAEEISADRLSVEATSEGDLNVRNTVLDGAAETAARGNGHFKASGFRGKSRRFYDSARRFLGGIIELSDSDSSEATLQKIREAMTELFSGDDDQSQDGHG